MRILNNIFVHCAASRGDVSAKTIRRWHLERNFNDIGYHYVIRFDGTIELGRSVEIQGAHVRGFNQDSIGICLAGGFGGVVNYTPLQYSSLRTLIGGLLYRYNVGMHVQGHNDVTNSKTCPNFKVGEWWNNEHIIEVR